ILQRPLDSTSKFLAATRQTGNPPVALLHIARWSVEQDLLEPVLTQPAGQFFLGPGIGEEHFHPLETIGCGSRIPAQKIMLRIEQAQIGSKTQCRALGSHVAESSTQSG